MNDTHVVYHMAKVPGIVGAAVHVHSAISDCHVLTNSWIVKITDLTRESL